MSTTLPMGYEKYTFLSKEAICAGWNRRGVKLSGGLVQELPMHFGVSGK